MWISVRDRFSGFNETTSCVVVCLQDSVGVHDVAMRALVKEQH